jgi:hypothetical protein
MRALEMGTATTITTTPMETATSTLPRPMRAAGNLVGGRLVTACGHSFTMRTGCFTSWR